jgi:hypothetical protein
LKKAGRQRQAQTHRHGQGGRTKAGDSPRGDGISRELARTIFGRLPMREVLEFEAIWPLRDFDGFLKDCRTHFGAKRAEASGK